MKIFLHNRKDVKVFQNSAPLKVYYEKGNEYVLPALDENGKYEVQFVKKSEFSGSMWFLKALLFWIIGILGFFTPKYAKCTHSLNCSVSGIDDGNPIDVTFIHPHPKAQLCAGVKVKQESVDVKDAEYVADKDATKRKKTYSALTVLIRIAAIILAIALIIKSFIS